MPLHKVTLAKKLSLAAAWYHVCFHPCQKLLFLLLFRSNLAFVASTCLAQYRYLRSSVDQKYVRSIRTSFGRSILLSVPKVNPKPSAPEQEMMVETQSKAKLSNG